MALNDKEKCFANEYIINKGNAYKAALAAGYSNYTSKVAYQWLEEPKPNSTEKRNLPFKPELKAYIDEQIAQMDAAKVADAKEVMEYLTSVMRGESKAEVVVTEFIGDGYSEARTMMKAPDEKERLKAADSLAKILGMNKEKLTLDIEPVTIVNDLKE